MRRAERLFQIVQFLRGGRLTTARSLAERLEVSERTIYRDVAHLIGSGVPIDGEAGLGYVLKSGFDIPPLMFSPDELEALLVGARMLQAWGSAQLSRAATEALAKIEAVVPDHLRRDVAHSALYAPDFEVNAQVRGDLDVIRHAIAGRRVLHFSYAREDGQGSTRHCRPLGLYFWGKVWTLVGWCELRDDFRVFRVDRMTALAMQDRVFPDEAGKRLPDYLKTIVACLP